MSKLLPKKHLSLEQAYIGFGAKLINLIGTGSISIENLWEQCNKCGPQHDFNDLILTLDYLYLINIVWINEEGKVCLN